MDRIPVYVGIDYHPSVVHVCVKDARGRDLGRARVAASVFFYGDRAADTAARFEGELRRWVQETYPDQEGE